MTRVATCSSNLRTEWLNRLVIHCGDREVHGSIPWIGRVFEFISLPPQATTMGWTTSGAIGLLGLVLVRARDPWQCVLGYNTEY